MNNSKHYLIQLKDLGDERGGLCVLEENKEFPFPIKRVFYDFNTDNSMIRGNHANRNSSFGLVSIVGQCNVKIYDGNNEIVYTLDSPFKMLIIEKMLWKEMYDFSNDNVLLIISDHVYDKNEYITNFEDYLKVIF